MDIEFFSPSSPSTGVAPACRFRLATYRDAAGIAELVNLANSGDGGAGWTDESGLYQGDRTDDNEVLEMMSVPGAIFLRYMQDGRLAGCVYLKRVGHAACMSMLAVLPELQDQGIGKQLIAEAERIVLGDWDCSAVLLAVIVSHRPELTAYYQRRGYLRTGRSKAFERNQAIQGRMAPGLRLEWMEKRLKPVN